MRQRPAETAGWLFVVTVCLAHGTVICSGLAAQDRSAVNEATRSGDVVIGMSLPEARSLMSRSHGRDEAAYALYGVGGALVVAGIVMAIVDAPRHQSGSSAMALAAPVAGGLVVGASGRF